MNTFVAFGLELLVTLLLGFLLMLYLRPSLYRVLVDLCGGEDRARFWSAFSTVLLIGAPSASALGYRPMPGSLGDSFLDVTHQLGQNLMTFLMALIALGLVVAFFALVAPRVPKERKS